MRNMLRIIGQSLAQNQALVLVTVTAASGATPRGAGARMLVGSQGRICGTIGGGAVEYRSIQMARQLLQQQCSAGHDFSLTRQDVENLGMICGGAVKVYFSYLSPEEPGLQELTRRAEALFAGGQPFWLLSDLSQGGRLGLYSPGEGYFRFEAPQGLTQLLDRKPRHCLLEGRDIFIEQLLQPGRVYVFGCGHVAQELVPVLSHVGFRCVALDDRPEFADPALFPGAEEVLRIDFSRIGDFVTIGPEDYVCVMTRGHAHDTGVQAQVLRCRPGYVGVIGSRSKAAAVRKALQEDYGLSERELDLVTTPIGLSIGAETPAEIAISIAGQLIQARAARNRG